jgi:hypothetical protein
MMTAEVINIQVKQESSDNNHQGTTANKVSEPEENGVHVSEESTSQESAPPAVFVQASATVDSSSISASEQLQRMIQQQYLVNLIQFQQSMLQVNVVLLSRL